MGLAQRDWAGTPSELGAYELRVETNPFDRTIELEPFGSEDDEASSFLCVANGHQRSALLTQTACAKLREARRCCDEGDSPLRVRLTSFRLNPPPALQSSASALPVSLC